LSIGDVCIADLLVVVLLPQISSDPPAEWKVQGRAGQKAFVKATDFKPTEIFMRN
jgi:hypothetical protein